MMKHNPALDGLRAVAAYVVVASHSFVPGFEGGAIGVDIFFVLSGFLITSMLQTEITASGAINLWRFYGHRAVRLYPPLLIFLGVWSVIMSAITIDFDIAGRVAIVAFYFTDYVIAFGTLGGYLGHTWSLAVEEHFYMVWPLVLIALSRLQTNRLVFALGAIFMLATAWRWVDFAIWGDVRRTIYRFDTNLAGLVLGGFAAVIPWRPSDRQARIMGLVGAAMLFALLLAYRQGSFAGITAGVTLSNIAAAVLVLSLTVPGSPVHRALSSSFLVYLGALSYSVYLWHYPIAAASREFMPWLPTFVIAAVLSTLFAYLSFEFVERPLRDWRRKNRAVGQLGYPVAAVRVEGPEPVSIKTHR